MPWLLAFHDIAFGMCHVRCTGIPHDHVVCFLAKMYVFAKPQKTSIL